MSTARRWLADALVGWSEEGIDAAQLVVSELVTNAVLHGRGPLHLAMGRDEDGAVLEVADHSPMLPAINLYGADATTGRGLLVVDGIARGWGVRRFSNGKGVWAAIDDAPIAAPPVRDVAPDADHARGCVGPSWDPAPALVTPGVPDPHSGGATIAVQILGLPLAAYQAARAQNDSLIREFRWLLERGESADVPARLLALAGDLARRLAGATDDLRTQVNAAIARGDERVDLEVRVPRADWEALLRFSRQLDEADEFCAGGDLLTLAASPGVRRFRNWYTNEVMAQVNGARATPWPAAWGAEPEDDR